MEWIATASALCKVTFVSLVAAIVLPQTHIAVQAVGVGTAVVWLSYEGYKIGSGDVASVDTSPQHA